MLHGIIMDRQDDMATVLSPIQAGDRLEIIDRDFLSVGFVVAAADIPFAHKIALRDIAAGENVKKCGEIIGRATTAIPEGDYLHVHNVQSLAGTATEV